MNSRCLFAALLICACALAPAFADFDKTAWQLRKEIKPVASVQATLGFVVLDKQVLLALGNDYSQLRLTDSAGRELPYKITESAGGAEIVSYAPSVINNSTVPGKYRSFVLDLGGRKRSNRLLIDTRDANFTCRVEVAGSDDNSSWKTLRADAYVFDFSRDNRARSAEVTYPETDFRYLRLKVFAYNGRVIRADGASVLWKRSEPAKSVVLFGGAGQVTQDAVDKTTEIVIALGGKAVPGGAITLESSTANYQRSVEVLGSPNTKEWTPIGSGYVLKYAARQFRGEQSTVSFGGGDFSWIRVRIYNGDDAPIAVGRVSVRTTERRLVFAPKAGGAYRLYYGNARAQAPIYDIETLYPYLSKPGVEMTEFSLGSEEPNPDFVKRLETRTWFEANPWVIWVAMGAAMLFLIALVLNLARQMRSPQPPLQ